MKLLNLVPQASCKCSPLLIISKWKRQACLQRWNKHGDISNEGYTSLRPSGRGHYTTGEEEDQDTEVKGQTVGGKQKSRISDQAESNTTYGYWPMNMTSWKCLLSLGIAVLLKKTWSGLRSAYEWLTSKENGIPLNLNNMKQVAKYVHTSEKLSHTTHLRCGQGGGGHPRAESVLWGWGLREMLPKGRGRSTEDKGHPPRGQDPDFQVG